MKNILICTPHNRHNDLVNLIALELPNYKVLRITCKDDLTHKKLLEVKPRWVFFPHWSWKIPTEIYCNFECVIFHMTDLPFGRGGSPLQNLILRGFEHTQLSAIKCISQLDAGPIYAKRPMSLDGTAENILSRASILIRELIVWIVKTEPQPSDQEGVIVEFNRRRSEDGDIANLDDLKQLYDYIRMLDAPEYPPAFLMSKNFCFEFTNAVLNDGWLESTVRIRKKND